MLTTVSMVMPIFLSFFMPSEFTQSGVTNFLASPSLKRRLMSRTGGCKNAVTVDNPSYGTKMYGTEFK